MAPSELLMVDGNIFWDMSNDEPGITWLKRLARKFPYNAWLPNSESSMELDLRPSDHKCYSRNFSMYELTLKARSSHKETYGS